MKRGEIWWATLPPSVGSSPGGRRPVVIVQADHFTESFIRTVVVIVVTTNLELLKGRGNVLLPAARAGLERDSVANISQIISADKSALTEFIGEVPLNLLERIEDGLRHILDLD